MTANTIKRELDALKAQGFKLQPSARPFAEVLHTYPKSVQAVIDRIAASDGRTSVLISEGEWAAIEQYPELNSKVNKYEDDVKTLKTRAPITPKPINSTGVSTVGLFEVEGPPSHQKSKLP